MSTAGLELPYPRVSPVRKFTGTNQNGPNYRNGPERTLIIPIAISLFSYFDTVSMYIYFPSNSNTLFSLPY